MQQDSQVKPVNHEKFCESCPSTSNQQRVHQRCRACRSSSEYSADAGRRFTTSRSSSFSSSHVLSPGLSHFGQLSCVIIVNRYLLTKHSSCNLAMARKGNQIAALAHQRLGETVNGE